ncbi:MAG: peptidylprolyl isomerase [Kiritimatiellia bacterium]
MNNDKSPGSNLVLVEVNGQTLTENELQDRVEAMMAQQADSIKPEQEEEARGHFRAHAIRDFITQVLLEGEAAARGIGVSPADLEKAVAEVSKRIPSGTTLEQALTMSGTTLAEFRSRLEKDIQVRALVDQELKKAVPATEAEAEAFYAQQKESMGGEANVSARHILVMSDAKDDAKTRAAKRAKIEGLRTQLQGGADFADLAKAHSECPSAQEGGSLGSFGRGQMVKPFEDAAFSQELNAVGQVVETQFGFHLIQVTDRQSGAVPSFAEAKGQIMEHLNRLRRQEIFQGIVDGLQAKATIMMDPSVEQEVE